MKIEPATAPAPRSLMLAGVLALAGCASGPTTPDAGTLMRQAETALGSAHVKTLVINGRGTGATFGQAYQPGNPWPALNVSTLNRSFNFETAAFSEAKLDVDRILPLHSRVASMSELLAQIGRR